jgi:Xaa-Pro aminopeptidase
VPIVASGPNVAPLHRMATDRIMRPGDMVMLDIGCYWMGHAHEFARTEIVPGAKPTKLQREVYTTVYRSMEQIIDLLRPGHTTWEVNRAARGAIEEAGYAEWGFQGQLGHSQGTSVQEPPTVAELVAAGEPEIELVPGMLFAMEPGIFIPNAEPGGVGCRIENVILLTDGGNEVLTRARYSEALLQSD